MAISNCVCVARKGINKHPILAVTSIATPGQSDTFQLLFDELSVLALKPLWYFKGEKTQLLAAPAAKATQPQLTGRTLICVGKCRLSPELLNLEGGKEKYSIIMFKFSAEEKQTTQGILGQHHSYFIDPGNPERRGTLNSLWQNTFQGQAFFGVSSPFSQLPKQAPTFWSQNLQTLLHKCSDSLLSNSFHPADSVLEPGVRDPAEATSVQYSRSRQLSPLTSPRMESPRLILKTQVIPLQICPLQLKLPDSIAQPAS